MSVATHFVSPEWHKSTDGKLIINSLIGTGGFGLLEQPSHVAQYDMLECPYKVFVSGKNGVGKTSTVAKLSGRNIPNAHHETPGIQTTVVYWPAKIMHSNRLVMFKLHLWDVGDNALKKFDHILPACQSRVDGVLFVFSFVDKASFDDVPHQMSRVLGAESQNACKFVMGTKLDLYTQGEVTQRDLQDFETNWKVPLFSVCNSGSSQSVAAYTEEVAPVLNYICDELWKRDQILSGAVSADDLMQDRITYC